MKFSFCLIQTGRSQSSPEPSLVYCTAPDGNTRILKENINGTRSLDDGDGAVYQFNRRGRLTHIQGKKYGNAIALAYGADGYLESIRALQGHRLTFYYDPQTHHLTSSRNGRGHSVSDEHDQVGNLVSVANAKGITSNFTYNRKSNLASATFP